MTSRDDAKRMVEFLLNHGETPSSIAAAMDNRVSARTIYRWKDGASVPQQASDLVALMDLYNAKHGSEQGSEQTQTQPSEPETSS